MLRLLFDFPVSCSKVSFKGVQVVIQRKLINSDYESFVIRLQHVALEKQHWVIWTVQVWQGFNRNCDITCFFHGTSWMCSVKRWLDGLRKVVHCLFRISLEYYAYKLRCFYGCLSCFYVQMIDMAMIVQEHVIKATWKNFQMAKFWTLCGMHYDLNEPKKKCYVFPT